MGELAARTWGLFITYYFLWFFAPIILVYTFWGPTTRAVALALSLVRFLVAPPVGLDSDQRFRYGHDAACDTIPLGAAGVCANVFGRQREADGTTLGGAAPVESVDTLTQARRRETLRLALVPLETDSTFAAR